MGTCIDWRLGFRQFSFRHITRVPPTRRPRPLGPAAGFSGMLLSPSPFGSRSAIRPRNLPPSPARLNRGYNRAPRGALGPFDVPTPAGLDRRLLALVRDLPAQPALSEGVAGQAPSRNRRRD